MARRDRRAAARRMPKGDLLTARYLVSRELLARSNVDPIDVVLYHLDRALHDLDKAGGDVLEHVVITVGRHPSPSYEGEVVVEAKTDKHKPEPERPRCSICGESMHLTPYNRPVEGSGQEWMHDTYKADRTHVATE